MRVLTHHLVPAPINSVAVSLFYERALTLLRQLLSYGYSHSVSCAKPSFVIFDIRALVTSGHSDECPDVWASECPDVKNYKRRFKYPDRQRTLFSYTHMATWASKG